MGTLACIYTLKQKMIGSINWIFKDGRKITGGTCEGERTACLVAVRERMLEQHSDCSGIGDAINYLSRW